MNLEQAAILIKACADKMNDMYGKVVFDEWVILTFAGGKGNLIHYAGPRQDHFQQNFSADVEELQPRLFGNRYSLGDFEFARYGAGTRFEAFMVIGVGLYLICNNTGESMEGISKDTRWLKAQVPFLELTDVFRKDPLVI